MRSSSTRPCPMLMPLLPRALEASVPTSSRMAVCWSSTRLATEESKSSRTGVVHQGLEDQPRRRHGVVDGHDAVPGAPALREAAVLEARKPRGQSRQTHLLEALRGGAEATLADLDEPELLLDLRRRDPRRLRALEQGAGELEVAPHDGRAGPEPQRLGFSLVPAQRGLRRQIDLVEVPQAPRAAGPRHGGRDVAPLRRVAGGEHGLDLLVRDGVGRGQGRRLERREAVCAVMYGAHADPEAVLHGRRAGLHDHAGDLGDVVGHEHPVHAAVVAVPHEPGVAGVGLANGPLGRLARSLVGLLVGLLVALLVQEARGAVEPVAAPREGARFVGPRDAVENPRGGAVLSLDGARGEQLGADAPLARREKPGEQGVLSAAGALGGGVDAQEGGGARLHLPAGLSVEAALGDDGVLGLPSVLVHAAHEDASIHAAVCGGDQQERSRGGGGAGVGVSLVTGHLEFDARLHGPLGLGAHGRLAADGLGVAGERAVGGGGCRGRRALGLRVLRGDFQTAGGDQGERAHPRGRARARGAGCAALACGTGHAVTLPKGRAPCPPRPRPVLAWEHGAGRARRRPRGRARPQGPARPREVCLGRRRPRLLCRAGRGLRIDAERHGAPGRRGRGRRRRGRDLGPVAHGVYRRRVGGHTGAALVVRRDRRSRADGGRDLRPALRPGAI